MDVCAHISEAKLIGIMTALGLQPTEAHSDRQCVL
jgi:hypothetical protein